MEMGKLTAKLRDAVPVCLMVDDKEIKWYKNIEIPDELKKLEYQDFKFDVPLNGSITFKIMFVPGVLPEEFPQTRVRRSRKPLAQEVHLQEVAPEADVEAETEPQPYDEQATEVLPASEVGAFTQTLEDAQAVGKPVPYIAEAMADGEAINAEVEGEGPLAVIIVDSEATESTAEVEAQHEDNEPSKKPERKGKKGAVSTEDADM